MPDYSDWLTKQQAAAAVGVSTKTIELFAKQSRLQQATRHSERGARIAVYHPADVDRLRLERQPEASAFVLPATSADSDGSASSSSTAIAAPRPPVDVLLGELLAAIVAAASEKSQKSERLFVTVDQAVEITGLPRSYLRRLIAEGKLEATRTRPRLVRRRDLERL